MPSLATAGEESELLKGPTCPHLMTLFRVMPQTLPG